jgi:hypothetical protein
MGQIAAPKSMDIIPTIANDSSIAGGCARTFIAAGAALAASYLNESALLFAKYMTGTIIPVDRGQYLMA